MHKNKRQMQSQAMCIIVRSLEVKNDILYKAKMHEFFFSEFS